MDELCLIYSGETTLFNDRPSLVTSNYYGAVPPRQDKTNDFGETVSRYNEHNFSTISPR